MASIFSFFSGAGFLDLGFEHSEFDIAFVNENHKPFLDAYKFSRDSMGLPGPEFGYFLNSIEEFVNSGSKREELANLVTTVKERGDLVGFIGGPPCPDFSVGGKNRGNKGENGKLTETYVEAINQHRPDFFLFENVKGLWRTKRHRTFYEQMKESLNQNGYILTERLSNCIEYGAPQDRDRILLFGAHESLVTQILGEQPSKSVSLSPNEFNWEKHIAYSREDLLKSRVWPKVSPFNEGGMIAQPVGVEEQLTIKFWFEMNDVLNHPNANHFFKPKSSKFVEIDEGDVSKKSFKRLHRWRYSPTAAYGNNEVHLHPYLPRRISAAEALAIQSLPPDFSLPQDMTLSNMFKTIGNGVPYLMALGVAQTIRDFLNQ